MDERKACQQLRQRFESAGFHIKENIDFSEHGLRFDLDGYDAAAKVGYEYVTDEAGDGWDVDEAVIAKLTELRQSGALSVLVVEEDEAPDEASLDRAIDDFLGELRARGIGPAQSAAKDGPPPGAAKDGPPPVPTAAKAPKGARKPKKR